MNYYNPYYMQSPMVSMMRPNLFTALRNGIRGINFGGVLNGTQKTLNIINQAIPLVKQVSPVVKNAKTMFRVMNEFKKTDISNKNFNAYDKAGATNYSTDESAEAGPKFFV